MRIDDKIEEVEKFLQELSEITPNNFEEYRKNFEKKAACERYFEKIVEAVVDLAYLVIREKKFEIPESEEHAFTILEKKDIILLDLTNRLKDAKSMRNFIIHKYGEINDELVFEAISQQLVKDINEFIDSIKKKK